MTAAGLSITTPNVAAGQVRLLDVPFVAQSEVLCGGAAAAMVLRYWGASNVYAEDFAELVDPGAQGITTETLTSEIEQRGWNVRTFRGTRQSVQRHLERGRPVLVLVRDSPDRYHYLVVVGWFENRVIVHDPAHAPFRELDMASFYDRWEEAGFWSLLVLPGDAGSGPPAATTTRFVGMPALTPGCHADVSGGIELAHRGALTLSEYALRAAADQCPTSSVPWRELAGLRILQARWTEAADLARKALEWNHADAQAWRLLATSQFAHSDSSEALRSWNQIGEPAIDLVQVEGLERTRHAIVEDTVSLRSSTLLTVAGLERARRRLSLLPGATSSRIGYRPQSGRARIDVAVSERPLIALDPPHLVRESIRAATERTVRLDVANPTGNGERWTASWRWWNARPRLSLSVDTPAPVPGLGSVWRVEASWERQKYSSPAHTGAFASQDVAFVQETRSHVGMRARDWITSSLYWDATAAIDEWSMHGTYAGVGLRVERHHAGERLVTGIELRGWKGLDGGTPFASWSLSSDWRSSASPERFTWRVRGSLDAVTSAAPRDLWLGAGVGRARRPLLRAHPLLDDGVINTARLSRNLASVTLEVEHAWRRHEPLQLSVVGFADTAHRWDGTAQARTGRTDLDVGIGFRLGAPGRSGRFRADIARGLRDGAVAGSVGWELPWPHSTGE
jgi:hypothetical protein